LIGASGTGPNSSRQWKWRSSWNSKARFVVDVVAIFRGENLWGRMVAKSELMLFHAF